MVVTKALGWFWQGCGLGERILVALCTLALAGCQKTVADYRACLDAHPWELKACDGKRLAMEAEERAYNNLSAGVPTNVNLQSR